MKICYLDTETTGLNAFKCDIWQLACIVEINGKVEEKRDFKMAPKEDCVYEQKALEMIAENHQLSKSDLSFLPDRCDQFEEIKKFLGTYVSKFNKYDKFLIVGYNVKFDVDFLRQFWLSFGDRFFGSYFLTPPYDVMGLVGMYSVVTENYLKNYKLITACEHLSIPINAHDAMSDIEATREVFHILRKIVAF